MSRFVPYLANEAIERAAASLIAEHEHARGVTIEPPVPVEDIVEKYLRLRIEFDDMHARHNIPRPPNGQPDILGAIYGDGSIFIDENVNPEEHRIVAKVDALMDLCDRLEASLAATAATRPSLLDALLAEALTPADARELEAAE